MATGDFVLFEESVLDYGKGVHALPTDTVKIGLITSAITPTAADATPRWADYSGAEVSGTGYTAGGAAIGNLTWAEAAGVATLDGDAVTWAQNASGPANCRWGIVYNDSAANKEAFGYIDLGGVVSLVDGPLTLTPHASGISLLRKGT